MNNQQLAPIFQLRELCLALLNPVFFARHANLIHRAALAAQEYVFSGASREYASCMGNKFQDLPKYKEIHTKYDLNDMVNPNLVMDLAWSFRCDNFAGIIDSRGNIKNRALLPKSRIMGVYHNSDISGTPRNAFTIYPDQAERIVAQIQQKTK